MSAQRISDRRLPRLRETTGLDLVRLWRISNTSWEGVAVGPFGGHYHVRIDPRDGSWTPSSEGCFGGEPAHGCAPFGTRYRILAGDPEGYYPASKRREDFETVAKAIRELGNAWVRGETPPYEVGSVLVSDAVVALSKLAVAANVPLEGDGTPPIVQRRRTAMREAFFG